MLGINLSYHIPPAKIAAQAAIAFFSLRSIIIAIVELVRGIFIDFSLNQSNLGIFGIGVGTLICSCFVLDYVYFNMISIFNYYDHNETGDYNWRLFPLSFTYAKYYLCKGSYKAQNENRLPAGPANTQES